MELPNLIRLDNFYTSREYRKLCNISASTTRNRIRSGLVATLIIDGKELIDTGGYPLNKRYKPNVDNKLTFTPLPAHINKDDLVHISTYKKRKWQSNHTKFLKAVLRGNIFGLIIAGEVFAYKHELNALKI